MRSVGLDVGAERPSLILLLLRKFREGFTSSVGDCEDLSPTCMLDLTYRRGTLKNVATGGGGEGGEVRTIDGNARANIFSKINDEAVDLMNVFGKRGSLSRGAEGRYVGRTTQHSELP